MQNGFKLLLKLLFALLGLFALYTLFAGYGFHNIVVELKRVNIHFVWILLTFTPTLLCYALAWWLCTSDHDQAMGRFSFAKLYTFFRMTVISIAWNNLTPFLKVAGEPLKALMLKQELSGDMKSAIISTVIYNYIHLMGTLAAFVLAALWLLLLYPLTALVAVGAWVVLVASLLLLLLFFVAPSWFKVTKKVWAQKWYRGMQELNAFFKTHPRRAAVAILLEVGARFIEGITFYYAFWILGPAISLGSGALIEVARTLIDTIFFFVPYQIGSREQGLYYFMSEVLLIGSEGYLAAAMLYRLVELLWAAIGYFWWVIYFKRRCPVAVKE
ncbi:MAG: flippase-like domain-containing protein [Oligoflexia bacterium]|nr:flippase-like domain-containing protein [Oligoflexia bacterium]MBF0365421.1 flippase-like domain-containing protein [Oligoflexia bacterium]